MKKQYLGVALLGVLAATSALVTAPAQARPYPDGGYAPVAYNSHFQNFTGVVTGISNRRHFNIRYNGETYNVYAISAPRRIRTGEVVRVNGRRVGRNDIRNADVSIVRYR